MIIENSDNKQVRIVLISILIWPPVNTFGKSAAVAKLLRCRYQLIC